MLCYHQNSKEVMLNIFCSNTSAFATLSNEIWHNRLGHPRVSILSSLNQNNSILCNKFQNNFFCQSCQLGKQIKLPFYESLSSTLYLFLDIVHIHIWTSPIIFIS